jgi:hypothetical protein
MALVYIGNSKVDGATHLAVVRVLRQEDRLVSASKLRKDRRIRIVPILPVNVESKTLNVKWETGGSGCYPKDGCHCLSHDDLSLLTPELS